MLNKFLQTVKFFIKNTLFNKYVFRFFVSFLLITVLLVPQDGIVLYAISEKSLEAILNNHPNYIPCSSVSSSSSTSSTSNSSSSSLSIKDVVYTNGPDSNRKIPVTLYIPEGVSSVPVLVFAPGRSADARSAPDNTAKSSGTRESGMYARYLESVAKQGFVVAGINYPGNHVLQTTQEVTDTNFVISELKKEAEISDIANTSSIGLFGHSDGGLLSAAMYGKNDDIKAQIILSAGGATSSPSGPPLLTIAGTKDQYGNYPSATASSPSYGAVVSLTDALHDDFIRGGKFAPLLDSLTGAFFKRFLTGDSSDGTNLKSIVEKNGSLATITEKGAATPSGSSSSTSSVKSDESSSGAVVCCDDNSSLNESGNVLDLSDIAKKLELQSAVAVNSSGKMVAEYNASTPPVSPASTMKLIIADTALQENLDLTKTVSVTSDVYYNGDSEDLSNITLKDALDKMLSISSNVSANILIKELGGPSGFSEKAKSHGYKGTDVVNYYGDPSKNKSVISDQALAMQHLFAEKGVTYAVAQDALKRAAASNNFYGVENVLANKWAGRPDVAGNVGMFDVKGENYFIGLYINKSSSDSAAKNAIKQGSKDIVDSITNQLGTGTSPSDSTSKTSIKKVYMLGDSITNGSHQKYRDVFKGKGVDSVFIDASGGRSWTGGGMSSATTSEGTDAAAKDAVDRPEDTEAIKNTDAVIIALGSNGGIGSNPISEVIGKIKEKNDKSPIYWVNTSGSTKYTGVDLSYLGPFNKELDSQSSSLGYTVIDWAKTVTPGGDSSKMPLDSDPDQLLSDGLHPTGKGQDKLVELVVNAVTQNKETKSLKSVACTCSEGSSTLSGDDNKAKIWNYFTEKGFKDFQIAGIMGNMQAEGGFETNKIEIGYISNGKWVSGNPPAYPLTSDEVPPDDLPSGQPGYGLVGWTFPLYKQALRDLSKERGVPASDLKLQLDYLYEVISTPIPGLGGGIDKVAAKVKASSSLEEATEIFLRDFERPAGIEAALVKRIVFAQAILDLAQSGKVGSSSSSDSDSGPSDSSGGTMPVIVLDPGHAGSTIDRVDPETKFHDGDYHNTPETEVAFDVATLAKASLEQAGYQVKLTKQSAGDSVFLRDRANIANEANADLAISIHTQGDKAFGTWQEIYTQKVGLYRGEGDKKVTFEDENIAKKSQEYATKIKEARDSIEVTSGTTEIKDNSFDGRSPIEPGNIPMVALMAKVPWVYLEAGGGANNEGLSDEQKATYAKAIVDGVQKAIPAKPSSDCGGGGGGDYGSLAEVINAWAWPEITHGVEKKPEYEAAIQKARSEGLYVGGIQYPGVDCGGFVTQAVYQSGYDKTYNSNAKGGYTANQLKWVQENWEDIGMIEDTSQLKFGDVALLVRGKDSNGKYIDAGHTYIWAGKEQGVATNFASASMDSRAPMLNDSWEKAVGPAYNGASIAWFRKK